MTVSLLQGAEGQLLTLDFQSYVRLFLNAINLTIDLPLSSFSYDNMMTNENFYLIQANLDDQLSQLDQNYLSV